MLTALTKYAGQVSAVAVIQAIIIQGSAIDLHPVHHRNRIFKFADDTYLVVPGVNTDTCQEEIDYIQMWAADNNLKLNRNKTKEIVFSSRRDAASPPSRPDIKRVTSLQVLGVIVNDVTMLLSSCTTLLYTMRVLRWHGTPTMSLHDIFRAIVVARRQLGPE